MKYSEHYEFALPTAEDNTLADIGVISQNFEKIDEVMKQNEDLGVELNRFEAETMDAVGRLNIKDADLQSQIDALGGVDVSDLQSQLDTKVDKVEGKGLSTNDYDDRAKDRVSKIGRTNLIPSDSRDIVQWIQDVYDSVFTSSADNTCLADRVAEEISHRQLRDENLQSQIDTKVDKVEGKGLSTNDYNDSAKDRVSKIGNVSKIPTASRNIVQWIQDVYDSVFKSSADNTCLADEVAAEVAGRKSADKNLQSQIDTKVTRKVAVVGSDSYNSDGWCKVASGTMTKWTSLSLLFAVHTPAKFGKYSGILQLDLRGGAEAIVTGDEIKLGWLVRTGFDLSQVIITVDGYNWALYYNLRSNQNFRVFFEVIQESGATGDKAIYNLHIDSAIESTAPLATATSTDLGTVNTANKLTTARNINGIAFDGSADINITANDIASTSGPEHNLAYEIGMTKAYLSAVEASIGTWSSGQTISRTIFSMEKSIKDIDMNADLTKSDLDAVKARIGSWGTGKTLYAMIADLTARIEALENSASGSTITRTLLIDWDVNTNGSTQGTVSKDADGLHASGSTSMRIANYWSNNVSAYDGITFTAYGSGKLRVEVGGVESSYVVLSTTPTTFTFDFAENGLTDLSSVEINLQTQGVYDLTVSDIYGYTKS